MLGKKVIAAIAAAFLGTAANAAVLQYDVSFGTSGSPNPAEISFTLDTDLLAAGANQTAGLTILSSNFTISAEGSGYDIGGTNILVGGLLNGDVIPAVPVFMPYIARTGSG